MQFAQPPQHGHSAGQNQNPGHQWPLRPGNELPKPGTPRPGYAEQLLALKRNPTKGRMSGFCASLAERVGVDVLLIRTLFVIGLLSAGIGGLLYMAGWSMTSTTSKPTAPLDRLGTRWRKVQPQVLLSGIVIFATVLAVAIGSQLHLGWAPLVIVALTIWTGQSAKNRLRAARYQPHAYPPPQAPNQIHPKEPS